MTNQPYYLLYFANKSGVLAGYDEVASIPAASAPLEHTFKSGSYIPPEATHLAVFESSTRFTDNPPPITKAIGSLALPAPSRPKGEPLFTFGLAADIHMNYQHHGRGAYEKWASALAFFAQHQAETIIVAGDVTGDAFEDPLVAQYAEYERLIAASPVARDAIYESIGNHGNTAEGRRIFTSHLHGKDRVHPFEGSPWYRVRRKGTRDTVFLFTAQEIEAPGETAHKDNFSAVQIDWLEHELDHASNTDAVVFAVIHPPFLSCGAGDRHGGDYRGMVVFNDEYPQTMRLKALLERHNNVIVLSGHTHLSFYDNENYSNENGTFCHTVHCGSTCQPTSYGEGNTLERSTDGRYTVTPTYGSEAYMVRVYENGVRFTGYNLSTRRKIPAACLWLPV